MFERNLQYINGQGGLPFEFDADGYAINPLSNANGDIPGNAFSAKDFRNLLVTAQGDGTIQVFGSIQNNPPDFSITSTITNSYVALMLADYTLANVIYDGTAGVTVTGGDTVTVEANTNVITWFAIKRSADTVDVIATVTDNI